MMMILVCVPFHAFNMVYARVQNSEKNRRDFHSSSPAQLHTHMAFCYLLLPRTYVIIGNNRQPAYVAVAHYDLHILPLCTQSYKSSSSSSGSDYQREGKYVYIHIFSLLFSFFRTHAMSNGSNRKFKPTNQPTNNKEMYTFTTRFSFVLSWLQNAFNEWNELYRKLCDNNIIHCNHSYWLLPVHSEPCTKIKIYGILNWISRKRQHFRVLLPNDNIHYFQVASVQWIVAIWWLLTSKNPKWTTAKHVGSWTSISFKLTSYKLSN